MDAAYTRTFTVPLYRATSVIHVLSFKLVTQSVQSYFAIASGLHYYASEISPVLSHSGGNETTVMIPLT